MPEALQTIEAPAGTPPLSIERSVYDVVSAACNYRDAMRGSYSPTIDSMKDQLVAAVDDLRNHATRNAVDRFLEKE